MLSLNLPQPVQSALEPLWDLLPLDQAMTRLVVDEPLSRELSTLVSKLVEDPAVAQYPTLQSALWLYVDELDRSHRISQQIHDADGSYWHGIMHRREGDFPNSHYWFHNTGADHPVYAQIDDYHPHQFIDDVHTCRGGDDTRLIALQRDEWIALVNHCVKA